MDRGRVFLHRLIVFLGVCGLLFLSTSSTAVSHDSNEEATRARASIGEMQAKGGSIGLGDGIVSGRVTIDEWLNGTGLADVDVLVYSINNGPLPATLLRTTTDSNGNYDVEAPDGFEYSALPIKAGYYFLPASEFGAGQSDVVLEWVGIEGDFTLSGRITRSDRSPYPNILVVAGEDVPGAPILFGISDSEGTFSISVPSGLTGLLLAQDVIGDSAESLFFFPESYSLQAISANSNKYDFVEGGVLPGDLDSDGEISSQEIRDIIGAFLKEDNAPGDICVNLGLGSAPGCDITSQTIRNVIASFLKQD